jgi:hypothetical protein
MEDRHQGRNDDPQLRLLPRLPGPAATLPRRLLQPLGLLGQLRFTLDRDATASAPYGTLTIAKKTP